MKFVSQLFQPFITIPWNAKIKNIEITCKSQKLLLECGLIRPASYGFFSLLPLALRAVDKLEALVRQRIEEVGGQQLALPVLTAAGLWEKTGRIRNDLMKVQDRLGKKYVLAPTHEEAITELLADVGLLSYKQLPLLVYQIGDKFRDEQHPKHGVLRARGFRMLDAYGALASHDQAAAQYARVSDAYRRLFEDLQLTVHRVAALCGDMGGSESHEWQLPAAAGEDRLVVCAACGQTALQQPPCHCGAELVTQSSVEVGHTFMLGTRYSEPLGAHFKPAAGPSSPLHMTCYGIGITRLLGASLEALSTETALRWPPAIAPYSALLIGPKKGSKESSVFGPERVAALQASMARLTDVLCDDRHELTVGQRLRQADKVGYPNIVLCGRAVLEHPPRLELIARGATRLLTETDLLAALAGAGAGAGAEAGAGAGAGAEHTIKIV